ncbi:hypothetical protein PAF17_11615 [Paracoccus sp. Z330]|uniref:Uncharacterized protein n=1 Tax=Paracoccus onchidii TaxID=3017813 RepID=A0ABT4ZFW5_9RHOB|nr:hypothetical protein [Paracoccus onchidii]MDB6178144.1 hypothetical protein [Paracoccus onchidii]
MELKCKGKDEEHPSRPSATWDSPQAAYGSYRPGLSPYLHYWHGLRASRKETEPLPDYDPDAGSELPGQMQETLEDLIRRSFGS